MTIVEITGGMLRAFRAHVQGRADTGGGGRKKIGIKNKLRQPCAEGPGWFGSTGGPIGHRIRTSGRRKAPPSIFYERANANRVGFSFPSACQPMTAKLSSRKKSQ